jgi:hypothetical protein
MPDKEFEAPDWVKTNEELKPLTRRQKHAFISVLSVVVPFCLWAGWFEWHRAHEGHWRAWVYTFEWPFFAVVAIYMFRKFLRGDRPKIPRPNLDSFDDPKNRE